jgi:hypothetical protein
MLLTGLMLAASPAMVSIAVALTLLGGSPSEPSLEVSQSRAIAASPAAVWAVIGGFCDLPRWHGRVRSCAPSRDNGLTMRVLDVAGVGSLAELQLDRDEAAMSYSYALEQGPWPVRQYRGELTVSPRGEGALVTWRATFRLRGPRDDGAVSDIEDLFRTGLAGLAREVAR